ncbi:MAG: hypothetical protein M1814_003390 [Vezdaea aestivalis]|nr:MAG: hypothetical protein M1814_003390 [Vezdaea aestivalis]
MVSFWPFKGDDTSAASFEKALSTLSEKIGKNDAQLNALRQNLRRLKALWTLYTSFAYLVYSIILSLVLGWSQWGIKEYGAIGGSPLLILGGRYLVAAYYNFRINASRTRLETLQKERETTIEKLKTATKYNSTQQLLDKYGGGTPKSQSGTPKQVRKSSAKPGGSGTPESVQAVRRTGFAPPPTANIRRSISGSSPGTVETPQKLSAPSPPASPPPKKTELGPGPAEFAPNAFQSQSSPGNASYQAEPQWYDRFLDLLMGEDETLAKNRIALVCQNCRLVNGQAPPGVKSLGELGRWRCGGCGTLNGEESEASRIVALAKHEAKSSTEAHPTSLDGIEDTDTENTGEGAPEVTSDRSSETGEVPVEKDKSEAMRVLPARKGSGKKAETS